MLLLKVNIFANYEINQGQLNGIRIVRFVSAEGLQEKPEALDLTCQGLPYT